ncbi:protein tyrosine phosphatase domain-containing protein 1-like isoform X2 [Symsagittifera roscoffensis]|uniref:protein tyrosine phosphatase domain-containing protein 1-like isoform X2 n=1 Tax=Symsagittifera roscoffensis TaxID=84072 RepID=UPI00307B1CCE
MPSTYLTANGKRELEVKPAYSWLGDKMRQAVSHDVICTVGCGGVECKFCVPEGKFDKQDFVIEGLFSNWVEPHFVAISRPSTRAMEKFHIVDQFLQLGVKSIVNLTTPGEHSNCGFELESSGFSYIPEDFMRRGVFFYNFPWPDFGTANNHELLDAVQVVDFAVSQGKVAVHCHAGKGRTGSLIACYFVYVHRVPASAAIFYVRNKRAGSIQTKGQVMMVKDFQTFLEHFWVIFPRMEPEIGLRTLETSLNLQNKILHGSERKFLKHTPKIVYVACKMLLAFAGLKATEEKFKLEGSLGEGSQFPPELEKIIDLYFERRLTALSNGIDRSFVHQNSEPVLGKGSFKSRSSVDLTDVGGKANERHNSEPPHRGMNPREHSRLSMHDKDQEMRLDDERDRSWQHVYPVESVISKVSDRKMESLQKRRTSVGSIDSTSKHIYDVSDKLENGTAARNGKVFPVEEILEALKSYDDDSVLEAVKLLEEEMNIAPRCWDLMLRQKDPKVVSVLLWDWFDQLKYSVLSPKD